MNPGRTWINTVGSGAGVAGVCVIWVADAPALAHQYLGFPGWLGRIMCIALTAGLSYLVGLCIAAGAKRRDAAAAEARESLLQGMAAEIYRAMTALIAVQADIAREARYTAESFEELRLKAINAWNLCPILAGNSDVLPKDAQRGDPLLAELEGKRQAIAKQFREGVIDPVSHTGPSVARRQEILREASDRVELVMLALLELYHACLDPSELDSCERGRASQTPAQHVA